MRVAVITPYHREDIAVIRRAHQSVLGQDMACTHVLVADGFARSEIDAWRCQHIKLPMEHKDGGSFARGIGGLHAVSVGFDYVAFLDADCWFDRNHVATLIDLAEKTGCPVVTSRRKLIRLDGSLLSPDDDHSDGEKFADTSTVMLHRSASDLLTLSSHLPPQLGPICDLLLWSTAKMRNYRTANTGVRSLNFQTRYRIHYETRGETAPPGTIDASGALAAQRYWNALSDEQIAFFVRGSPRPPVT